VDVDGVAAYRLDLACPHARVVVEHDGEECHSDPLARAADEARRTWLRDHGWYVIVVTKESFDAEAAAAWTGELRDVLRERGVNPC
jgi:very-short-patch-repair endonuclease